MNLRHNRIYTFLTVIVCLAAMTATGSAASGDRSVTKAYSMANGMIVGSGQAYWSIGTQPKIFKAERGERTVVISISDATSPSVRGHLHTDIDGDGDMDEAGDFCSESDPIAVRPGQRIEVSVLMGECPGGDPSLATEGEITAKFSS
jgi:hypothetical protein